MFNYVVPCYCRVACLWLHIPSYNVFYCTPRQFPDGAIMNNAAPYVLVQIFLQSYIFISFRQTPSNGISETQGLSMLSFRRACQILFWSRCITLPSHQQCMRILTVPYTCQYLAVFSISAVLGAMQNLVLWMFYILFNQGPEVGHFHYLVF